MYQRAEVLLATGKTEQSLTLVKRLRSEHPEHPGYRLLQGRIEWQLGQHEAAGQTLRLSAGDVADEPSAAPVAITHVTAIGHTDRTQISAPRALLFDPKMYSHQRWLDRAQTADDPNGHRVDRPYCWATMFDDTI